MLEAKENVAQVKETKSLSEIKQDAFVSDMNWWMRLNNRDVDTARKEKSEPELDAKACFDKGLEYYNKSNYTEAVKWYRKAADQGDAIAQYQLGRCYYNGEGVQQDYAEAIKLYRKAAEQGGWVAELLALPALKRLGQL